MATYRVGIIGCGRIASTFEEHSEEHPVTIAGAFAALPSCQLVAAANRGEPRLRAFGERWGVTALYHDYRQMLAKEKLDIVAIATHPPLHPEMALAACEAGVKGIFCEKPMALSLGECDAMIAACRRARIPLLVNCTRRWSGEFEALRRLVHEQSLGELLHLVGHCCGAKPTPDWEAETEGPLIHDAVHLLDIMRFFAGDMESVIGTATRRKRQEFRVEDTSYSLLQFRGGADGVLIVDELTDYTHFDLELQFERGLVRLGFGTGLWISKGIEFEAPNWEELFPGEMPAPAWSEPGILRAARDLVECIEQRREPRCNGQDGRAAMELIMAIYESQRRDNARVTLPLGTQESLLEVLRREGRL
jgi:UDP-N-acetyl-2-amino-2-deoxyglucuronate dehydrogenase